MGSFEVEEEEEVTLMLMFILLRLKWSLCGGCGLKGEMNLCSDVCNDDDDVGVDGALPLPLLLLP